MSTGKVCLLSLVLLAAAGCATPYKSNGLGGGYSEKKISDSAYVVSFNGNGFASKDRVYYFWMYRCAELTLKNGYSLFYIRANEANAPRAANISGSMTPVVYRPSGLFAQVYSDEVPPRGTASVLNRGELIKVRGGTVTTYTYIPGGTSTAWSYSGTVLMFQKPLPQEELFALDAQVLVDELKPYVTSNGSGVPPARSQMMKRAFTAHAKIDFGHDIEVTAGAPPATTMSDASPPPVGQPRTVGAIQEKIDLSQVYFYDAFQSHMEHAQDKTGGKVALGFTITPNGTVKECHVALNTFTDKMFVATLLSVCRHFQFGPENVLETNVKYYPMEFTPLSETSALTNR